jgi:uncharacterized protein YjbI with pentapeptide repeats
VLPTLDEHRKGRVVQFLNEAGLIAKGRPVLDLGGADLQRAHLFEADLSGASLGGADLREANLSEANLSEGPRPLPQTRGFSQGHWRCQDSQSVPLRA